MDVVELTKKLIEMDSSTTEYKTLHIAKFLKDLLSKNGFRCELIKKDKNANLIAEYGKNPELVFSGHMDTVDPNFNEWKSDPYKPYEKDKKLYGLGSCDMKSGIAASIVAAINSKLRIKKGVKFILTYDEENTFDGINSIPKKHFKGVKYSIVCEPTNLIPITAHKGKISFKLIVYGKSAHGSVPWEGINSIEYLIEILNKIKSLNSSILNVKNQILGNPSYNLGVIKGGRATNIVPAAAKIEFEYRSVPELPSKQIKSKIENLISKYLKENKLKYKLECLFINEYFTNKNNSELTKKLVEHSTTPSYFNGTTEASNYSNLGIDTVVFGPGGLTMAHKANEYVEIKNLKKSQQIYEKMIDYFG